MASSSSLPSMDWCDSSAQSLRGREGSKGSVVGSVALLRTKKTRKVVKKVINVTQHEKTMFMYTEYISLCYSNYLTFCVVYTSSVNCVGSLIVGCIIIDTLCLEVIKIQSLKNLSNFVCT